MTEHPLSEIKANLFKGLAHPARIRVLELLDEGGEVPVSDLIAATGLEPSNLSQHLAVLRRYELVESDRRGGQVLYRLASPRVAELLRVSRQLLAEMLRTTRQRIEATLQEPADADERAER
ncbi:metalloregulator ArsR/SmtB family transcription factor [Cellulomonas sp.]|uniref:ArsR/SmtB family transcription factor n=1 Tax=Cellulomonas sp. TaxID=40001 RepID=UPI002D256608|nr:metalloregulator ArsR/SmtB family transcription factor [Cellulomonas sp.]HYQ75053.1 metalloregulator ArsR/SmtB family transcription factor [Cellulomonas sp.]